MSRQPTSRRVSAPITIPGALGLSRSLQSIPEATRARRSSLSLLTSPTIPNAAAQKASRMSKLSQRLVVLPSEPQTRPFPDEISGEVRAPSQDVRSEGERMSKAERHRAGYSRMTAYSVAEGIKMRHLVAFLKREHAVLPRVFDEAIYVVCPISDACSLLSNIARCTISHYSLAMRLTSMCVPPRHLNRRLASRFSPECPKRKSRVTKECISLRRKRRLNSPKTVTSPRLQRNNERRLTGQNQHSARLRSKSRSLKLFSSRTASRSSLGSTSPRNGISWTTWKLLAYGYARETKTTGRSKSAISRYVSCKPGPGLRLRCIPA